MMKLGRFTDYFGKHSRFWPRWLVNVMWVASVSILFIALLSGKTVILGFMIPLWFIAKASEGGDGGVLPIPHNACQMDDVSPCTCGIDVR